MNWNWFSGWPCYGYICLSASIDKQPQKLPNFDPRFSLFEIAIQYRFGFVLNGGEFKMCAVCVCGGGFVCSICSMSRGWLYPKPLYT